MRSKGIHLEEMLWEMSQQITVLYFDSNFTEVVPKGQIDNMPALVQVMAWCQIRELGVDEIMRLSPVRREAFIWTNADLLSIGPWRTYFNEILVEIQKFLLKKMHFKISSAKWWSFCLGLGVLTLGHASPYSFNFLSSDWSSSFRVFADKLPVRPCSETF